MKKEKSKIAVESILSTVLMGLLVYAAYSLWYIFYGTDSGFDVHLYTGLSGITLGWFLLLFVQAVAKESGWVKKLIAFLAGNAFFHALIWGINAKINPECMDNYTVIIYTFTVTFAVLAIIILATFALRAKCGYKALNIVLAVIYFAVSCCGMFVFNIENIKALSYKKNVRFDSISAEEMKLTDSEKKLCSEWFNDNFFSENGEYPFTFKIDGEKFNPADWKIIPSPAPDIKTGTIYKNGKTDYIVLANEEKGLEVTVEATEFSDNATCQWTVYIKNTGNDNSGIISDFYALDSSFATGNAELYYSMGSDTAASDFSLISY